MREGIIAGIGLLVLDETHIHSTHPGQDDKVTAEDAFEDIGGPVPIALMYLSRLGWNTRLASAIGDDVTGEFIQRRLQEESMDTKFLAVRKGKQSGLAHIWLTKGTNSRAVSSFPGTVSPLEPNDISRDFFDGVRHLHIDGRNPLISGYAAVRARELGITVSYDAGNYKPGSENLLALANIVQSPRRFLRDWQGINDMEIAAEKLREYGPSIAIVTDGENGLAYSHEGGTFYRPAYKVGKVVDTNGAGDIFAGAFIHGNLSGWSVDKSISFASAAAALKCMTLGKRNLPSEAEVLKFIGD